MFVVLYLPFQQNIRRLFATVFYLIASVCVEAGKYDRCKLARDLLDKYQFPLRDVSKLICLAHWESAYDTAAVNKGSYPNTLDYGIFQINNYKWCKSSLRPSQNRCRISCERLRDDDITDDVQCLKTIMSQSSFDEWMSHGLRCQFNTEKYLSNCDMTSRSVSYGVEFPKPLRLGIKLRTKPFKVGVKLIKPKKAKDSIKIRLKLTDKPKGLKVDMHAPAAKINYITEFVSGFMRFKPFFSMHNYVTKR